MDVIAPNAMYGSLPSCVLGDSPAPGLCGVMTSLTSVMQFGLPPLCVCVCPCVSVCALVLLSHCPLWRDSPCGHVCQTVVGRWWGLGKGFLQPQTLYGCVGGYGFPRIDRGKRERGRRKGEMEGGEDWRRKGETEGGEDGKRKEGIEQGCI